jgi:uncharacterized Tic20 family protein
MTNFCVKCGRGLNGGAFCPSCGTSASTIIGTALPPLVPGYEPPPAWAPSNSFYSGISSQEKTLAMWAHLAPLLCIAVAALTSTIGIGLILGVFIWVPPLIIRTKSTSGTFGRRHATESLNFQLYWLIMGAALAIPTFILGILTLGLFAIVAGLFYLAIGIFIFIVMIIATIKGAQGSEYRYPFVLFGLVKN